uniref:Uncharacterized protein n=1 Tax=Timema poppense TaxID=170557 RepID=A0A7R9GSF0_TIMPO|nr:unnamed protein product [Timema poppensis]
MVQSNVFARHGMIRSLWNTSYSLSLSPVDPEWFSPREMSTSGAAAWQQALALHEVHQQRKWKQIYIKCWVQWQDSTAATHYNCTRGFNMKLSLHM